MITADQVVDTLRLLIPGFVALKVFYVFGQRTKRADWEWTLWSVLLSAPIAGAATWIAGVVGASTTSLSAAIVDCGVTNAPGETGDDLRAILAACVNDSTAAHNADLRLLLAVGIALLGGLGLALAWQYLSKRVASLREKASLEAWDAVLSEPHWVQLKVGDLIYSGKVKVVADPVETDDLDIYITEPAIISGSTTTELTETAGILVARDKIDWIQVLKSPGSTPMRAGT